MRIRAHRKERFAKYAGLAQGLSLFLFFISSSAWGGPLPVVVTLPVLRDLVQNVGKDRVQVQSLITGLEGEHTYTPKPSDIRAIQKAKLLVTIGLGLETWMEPLIQNADRPDLVRIVTSKDVPVMFHGNPHIWLDPENAKIMVNHISEGLSRIDPTSQAAYRANASDYILALDRLTRTMIGEAEKLKPDRRKIITHHAAWPYFAHRFGFVITGEIQTQIGTHGGEPSAKQMQRLIQQIRKEGVRLILSEPQLNQKIPDILAEETGIRRVVLSPQPEVLPGTETYLNFIRYNVTMLVKHLQ